MTLLALAYPELSPDDYRRIQEFRKQHDPLYPVVEPHFTLVFPVHAWTVQAFAAEIQKQARNFRRFDFCLRCSTLNKDAGGDSYYTFLVPDEGYSQFVKLHDQLYADRLFPHRRLDIDYIPHVTVGSSRDPLDCIAMVRKWNEEDWSICGRVAVLDIVNYENNAVTTLARIPLAN